MTPTDYWRRILSERHELARSPESDVTLTLRNLKSLIIEAFAAGERSKDDEWKLRAKVQASMDPFFGKGGPFERK